MTNEKVINQTCAMQHIIVFEKQALNNEKADFSKPCQNCKCAKSCNFEWHKKISSALPEALVKINMVLPEQP